jgi:hypothetical protein
VERLRGRALLREFRTCVDADGLVYETAPASYRSPTTVYRSPIVVQEDAGLLMVYDNALMRMEGR